MGGNPGGVIKLGRDGQEVGAGGEGLLLEAGVLRC